MAQTILVVEDEARIASFVKRGLEAEGYSVIEAADGAEGVRLAGRAAVDLIVLDLMLPVMTGEEVLVEVRRVRPGLPVIVLTAKDSVRDRVANLDAGADDYVTKPFSLTELVARIRANLRPRDQAASAALSVGRVELNLLTRRARLDSREVDLTAREFALLETFMRHPDHILSEFQLLDLVWGYDFDPGSNVVEVYVGYLRKKLSAEVIQTVRGAGYRFVG